jgi:putative chitinase
MAINRAFFFGEVRANLFNGSLKQSQVDGMNSILDEWEENHSTQDDRWLAYMLATAYHETGRAMLPVEENLNYSAKRLRQVFPSRFSDEDAEAYAGDRKRIANRAYANKIGNGDEASGDGWRFRGRGLVQITGRANYAKFGIEATPDDALNDVKTVAIMFRGMIEGLFTGRRLSDYFSGDKADWTSAREIILAGNLEAEIGGYGKAFYRSIGYTTG